MEFAQERCQISLKGKILFRQWSCVIPRLWSVDVVTCCGLKEVVHLLRVVASPYVLPSTKSPIRSAEKEFMASRLE